MRHKARQERETETAREVARLELSWRSRTCRCCNRNSSRAAPAFAIWKRRSSDENEKSLALLDADFARQQAQLDLLRTTGQLVQIFQ